MLWACVGGFSNYSCLEEFILLQQLSLQVFVPFPTGFCRMFFTISIFLPLFVSTLQHFTISIFLPLFVPTLQHFQSSDAPPCLLRHHIPTLDTFLPNDGKNLCSRRHHHCPRITTFVPKTLGLLPNYLLHG